MNKSVKTIFLYLAFVAALSSCDNAGTNTSTDNDNSLVECPTEIANIALQYAKKYASSDTEYKYGGQDLLRAINLDCSGLVVNCYLYAVNDSRKYYLPFYDAAVIDFFNQWTVKTDNPRQGDLIFMGDSKNSPTHISLFVRLENDNIYFIDSTLKPEENINGVNERNYPKDDKRFLSFGRLLIGIY